jgi:hypothetical protein
LRQVKQQTHGVGMGHASGNGLTESMFAFLA